MARYKIKDNETGKTFVIEGPEGATEDELQQAAESYVPPTEVPETNRVSLNAQGNQPSISFAEAREMAKKSGPLAQFKRLAKNAAEGAVTGGLGIGQAMGLVEPEEVTAWKEAHPAEGIGSSTMQFAGEQIPLAIGTAGASIPGSLAIKGATGVGMKAAPKIAKTLSALAEAGQAGAISSKLMAHGTGEEQPSAASGAGLAMATLPVVKGLGAAGRFMATPFNETLSKQNATSKLLKRLGPAEAQKTVAQTANYVPDPTLGTTHTTPGVTDNLNLASIEKAARREFPVPYTEMGETNNALRKSYIDSLVPTEKAVQQAKVIRRTATDPLRESVEQSKASMRPVLKEIRARMKTSEGLAGTPSRSVLEDARRMLLTKRSSTTQAERLAATRRALSESLSTGVNYTDAFRSAPRADKTAKALMEKMDDTLNASTGNKWTQYLENYSSLSKPINEMEATTKISQELTDPLKKGKLLRQSELASAVKKHGEDIFGSKLTPEKQAAYQKVADDIAKERITDRLNASGSTDDMNQLLEATKGLEGPVIGFRSIGLGALRGLQRMMPQSLDKSLSDLMLDPKLYSKAMADALRRGGNKTMADRLSENMKTAIGTSTMQRMGD